MLGMYRWLHSIAHKVDDVRLPAGVLAQEVNDAFIAEGLDGCRYVLLLYDTWDEKTDPNSGEVTPAVDRYALRYDELTCFMLAAFEARLAAAMERMIAQPERVAAMAAAARRTEIGRAHV